MYNHRLIISGLNNWVVDLLAKAKELTAKKKHLKGGLKIMNAEAEKGLSAQQTKIIQQQTKINFTRTVFLL